MVIKKWFLRKPAPSLAQVTTAKQNSYFGHSLPGPGWRRGCVYKFKRCQQSSLSVISVPTARHCSVDEGGHCSLLPGGGEVQFSYVASVDTHPPRVLTSAKNEN